MPQSKAMEYRLSLPLPPNLDTRKSNIQVYTDPDDGNFVITVAPLVAQPDPDNKALFAYYRHSDEMARSLWLQKYGKPMPEHVDGSWVEVMFAWSIPYVGGQKLTDSELQFIQDLRGIGDFTLDMLWLMVDGLGWRPGKPVSEDDPGWIAIWAEEEKCACYHHLMRQALDMPEVPIGKEGMPLPVKRLYGLTR